MIEKITSWRFLTASNLVLLCLLLMLIAFGCKEKTEEQTKQFVFNLDEVSVFDVGEVFRDFIRCQSTFCDSRPRRPVKYPAFKSEKPLYGSVHFAGRSIEFHTPGRYHFAIDESVGTGKEYDRLYFDHNCDLDLTNETPLMPQKSPPDGALLSYPSIEQQVCFESFEVTFDFGPTGKCAIEIMPRLMISQGGHSELSFVATKARKGQINIGGVRYYALLGYGYSFGDLFEQTSRAFYLIPKIGTQDYPRWLGADQLRAMHKIDGKYYRFSATPAGDKLFVQPYDGDFGTFEVGAGGRDMYPEMTIQGSLCSEDMVVAVGELKHGRPRSVKSCRLPVGDYLPGALTVTFGLLRIEVSKNYHSDGKLRNRSGSPLFYGIKIRKDKPFVLDFSNKPEVMFVSPAQDHRVKIGEQLQVESVLIDPKLDIIIRRLEDITRKQKKEYVTSNGQKRASKQLMSLEPKVLITRANGEKVAEGVMSFGSGRNCRYSWRVPTDLKLNGNEETFNVQVEYDTLELYGKVTATRQFVIYRD